MDSLLNQLMKPLIHRIALLEFLGELFRDLSAITSIKYSRHRNQLEEMLPAIGNSNSWFTNESIYRSIAIWGETLLPENIRQWKSSYDLSSQRVDSKIVFVIMAGNIPMVGFHDFISTLLSGNRFVGKLSSRDTILFPLIRKWIIEFDHEWERYIELTSEFISEVDAVIATGSNNTSRLIRQRFTGCPMIIRHNRNSIGLLTKNENNKDLEELAKDILWYYGLGCRNTSLLFIPENYKLDQLVKIIEGTEMARSASYDHNLAYQRAKASMHNNNVIDAKKILFSNKFDLNSPLGMVNYTYYKNPGEIEKFRKINSGQIQCVVGNPQKWINVIPFGKSQKPALNDYADGVDTLKFLINL